MTRAPVRAAEVNARAEALAADQSVAFRYLEAAGFRRVGSLGNRFRSPDGRLDSLRTALQLAVRADLEGGGRGRG